jgi:hypothetical protein
MAKDLADLAAAGSTIDTTVLGDGAGEETPPVVGEEETTATEEVVGEGAEVETGTEVEGEGEVEGEEVVEEETPAPIDPRLLVEAGRLGIDPDEALAFGSSEGLQAALRLVERVKPAGANVQGGEAQERPAAAFERPNLDQDWFKIPNLKEAGVDDDLANALSVLSDQARKAVGQVYDNMAAQTTALQEELTTLRGRMEDEAQTRYEDQFDAACDRLGDDWKELLGQGDEVDEKQAVKRQALARTFTKLAVPEIKAGRRFSFNKMVQQAANLEFPAIAKNNTRKGLVKAAKKRTKIRQPGTPSQTEGLTEEEKALAVFEQGVHEKMGVGSPEPEIPFVT